MASAAALAATALDDAPASLQRRLESVRVCGAGSFDPRTGICRKDESREAIESSQFNCSARAKAGPGERFAGRFLYRGKPFPTYGTNVGSKRKGVYIYLTAGPYPMPGGPWACELKVGGELVRKPFRSAGPDAQILHVLACPTSHTTFAGRVRVCARDESLTNFSATEPVTCSAVFAGGKGKTASIAFVREGKTVFSGNFKLPLPVTAAGPRIDPAPTLEPGKWTWRWSLAGRFLTEMQFLVR